MKKWFECVVKSNKAHVDTGAVRAVLTKVLLEALSYTEAETRLNMIMEEGEIESQGEFLIKKISKSSITDVPFHFDEVVGINAFQECQLNEDIESDFDDYTNWRVVTSLETLLINAEDAREAVNKVEYLYTVTEHEVGITSLTATKIDNVFRYKE